MSIRVLVVKNEAKQKNSDFSILAFRDSIPMFKYAPKANKEYLTVFRCNPWHPPPS
jgi:hypothetical protein